MAPREYTDEQGVIWRVSETQPEQQGTLPGDFRDGWLTFESNLERRRLSPVPAGWSLVSDARLAMLGRLAESTRGVAPLSGETTTRFDSGTAAP